MAIKISMSAYRVINTGVDNSNFDALAKHLQLVVHFLDTSDIVSDEFAERA